MIGQALLLESPNGPLRRVEREVPQPGRGQVLVRNLATAVNYHDILNVMGVLPNLAWPRVPFSDNCGEVVAAGADCGEWRPGDRVMAGFFPGWAAGPPTAENCAVCYGDQVDGFLQTHTLVEAGSLVRAPAGLAAREAATLCCAGSTAWRSVVEEAQVSPGQTVVVQGTGGVSLFALQLAKLAGARVILLSSSDEKLALGRQLGADHLINYRADPAWDEAVIEITGGGADLIVEIGGADTLLRSINAVRVGGHVSVIGVRSGFGQAPALPVEAVLIKNITLRGLTVGSILTLRDLSRAVERHALKPVISKVYGLGEAAEAMALMESQQHIGKIAIQIADEALS